MQCWSCNPFCGKCLPPSMKSIFCPECNTLNVCEIQVTSNPTPKSCWKCGCDLTAETIPVAKFCKHYDTVCGNPCGQADEDLTLEGAPSEGTSSGNNASAESGSVNENAEEAVCPFRVEPVNS